MWKINDKGILTDPELHDGYVEALSVVNNKWVALECRTVKNERMKINFGGVRILRGNDFREGNIILNVAIYQGTKIPESEIEQLLFNQYSKRDAITKTIEELHSSNEFFVHLECSYGLELKIFCKEIRFDRNPVA